MTNPNDPAASDTGLQIPIWGQIKTAKVTSALIAASIVVAVISSMGTDLKVLSWLTVADLHGTDRSILGGLSAIESGQVWRLLTPIFIHFGFLHILFNSMWLWDLGGLIERRWSPRTLVSLVLISGVVANVAQYVINGDLSNGVRTANALSGGMSGVVYALLGYIWMRGRLEPAAGIRLSRQTVVMMIGWLLLCCTGLMGHVGNMAHVAGLMVGLLMGYVAVRRTRTT